MKTFGFWMIYNPNKNVRFCSVWKPNQQTSRFWRSNVFFIFYCEPSINFVCNCFEIGLRWLTRKWKIFFLKLWTDFSQFVSLLALFPSSGLKIFFSKIWLFNGVSCPVFEWFKFWMTSKSLDNLQWLSEIPIFKIWICPKSRFFKVRISDTIWI